jgi:hypothetical protein
VHLVAADDPWQLESLSCHYSLFTMYFPNVLWYDTLLKQGTTHRPTSNFAHLNTIPSHWPRAELNMSVEFAGLGWSVFVGAAFQPCDSCRSHTWPSNQAGGAAILPSFSFYNQIPHRRSMKPWWVCFAPHEDKRIQLLSTVRSRRWKNNFMVHLKVH